MVEPIAKRLRTRIGRVRRFLTDRRARSEVLTRWRCRDRIHQDTSYTRIDRYPALFAAVARHLGREGRHRILSFGCASGEEVVTLRRYFPDADLTGADINRACLAACRRLPADARRRFVASTPDAVAAAGPFDAIFCMAVLQRRPDAIVRQDIRDIARLYPFSRFEAEVARLVAYLAPGGLLVVDNCQYLIAQTASAALLDAIDDDAPRRDGGIFDRSGRRIDPTPRYTRIYRRTPQQETRS